MSAEFFIDTNVSFTEEMNHGQDGVTVKNPFLLTLRPRVAGEDGLKPTVLLYSQLSPLYSLCGEAAMGLLGFEPRTKGL